MIFQCINIRQVPRELLKTAAYGLGFQYLPRDLANVNAWKTMFDPYSEVSKDVLRPPYNSYMLEKRDFSEQFRKLINRYKRIGYSLDIMRQTACLVVNPIIVDGYASLFNCTTAVRASDSMTASS